MSSKDHNRDLEDSKSGKGQSPRRRYDGSIICSSPEAVAVIQKVFAETVGTYFLVFVGCGTFIVDKQYGSITTFPGMCVAWGLIIMVMVYAVGHISGAHLNPAVTITFAIFRQFPYTQVPSYIAAQLLGSILASGTLCLLFDVEKENFFGTVPNGSEVRSLILEIIITFLLMFVISGVATDNRSTGELAGIAIGMTILINALIAGYSLARSILKKGYIEDDKITKWPVSGASMNPARSLGPAIVMHEYKGIWIYMVGPLVGAILGGFAYNLIRFTDKPLNEITKSSTLLRTFTGQR